MGKSEMQKIQRKKLQEEENTFAEEIQRLIELAMENDRRKFQELETEKADETVWLMKCPPRVAKAWRDLSASSSSSFSSDLVLVAKHVDSIDLLLPDLSPKLSMEMVNGELWNISKPCSLNDFGFIFSEAYQGEVAVEGTVTHKFDLRPYCGNEEHGKLYRERNKKQTKVFDYCRREHLMPTPAMVPKKLKRCVKRTRGDRSKVEAKMFELYERQPKWTLKQLVLETNQPELFLKEILRELCVYNAGGGDQRTYQLKPEYKIIGKEDTTVAQ
ncbi:unnamed protein product [Thlaspi arvense]|uniref:TFIIF beta subunit HTH domain-containing protein n=1 Tax=Thlaspi arvense TaxID=13288 RepID=A0AAU9RAR6_THLAR|nr:unnamed protein product [Thlaspi arvense]